MLDRTDKRAIFVDTSELTSKSFDFTNPVFDSLIKVCANERFSLIGNAITDAEVRQRISVHIEEGNQKLKTVQSKWAGLRKSQKNDVFMFLSVGFDLKALKERVGNSYQDFLDSCDCHVIDVYAVDLGLVFERYFGHKPPFGSGKKKNEFPDAIVGLSVKEWAIKEDVFVYVVSSDSDFKAFCEAEDRFHCFENTEKLLDHIYAGESFDAGEARTIFRKNQDIVERELERALPESFNQLGFSFSAGYYPADGEIVEVDVCSIDIVDANVIDVEDNLVTAELEVEVEFEAQYSFWDEVSPNYEFGFENAVANGVTVTTAIVYPIVRFSVNRENPSKSAVEIANFPAGMTIEVEVDLRDEYGDYGQYK